ncbi:sigma-70 family RNA polymerase sigma factor [Tenacibaculum sp.]|uniref:sigma-70 family RNA polymerase sigma factor n=1 Tax=Tenacibaculum TaxID=104267 RepID=UPI0017FDC411|nr:sigma-70 family RNA polymerase sigma factor [Tenacibaculum sp.]NVK10111.1 sigma-70 family RNA polymerase sigma factor [Tenacibaculum sp.]
MTFNKIWDTYKDHLLNFVNTKVNDKHIADDILQEVSLKLYKSLAKEIEIKNYKNWLFQVTRNTIADYYRKQVKQNKIAINQPETNINFAPCVCDLSSFIIQQYLHKKYSEPLYLSDIEQKPQQEIADTLNLSLTATKSRIQRGRKKLKELAIECVDISYNNKGQITDFTLKKNCELPQELKNEMKRINFIP